MLELKRGYFDLLTTLIVLIDSLSDGLTQEIESMMSCLALIERVCVCCFRREAEAVLDFRRVMVLADELNLSCEFKESFFENADVDVLAAEERRLYSGV